MSFPQLSVGLFVFFLINLPVPFLRMSRNILCVYYLFSAVIGCFVYWHKESVKFHADNLLVSSVDPDICFLF